MGTGYSQMSCSTLHVSRSAGQAKPIPGGCNNFGRLQEDGVST